MVNNTNDTRLLRMSHLILLDEAPVAPSDAIIIVDQLQRNVTDCYQPFGGKTIVFGGNFRQVLLVVSRASTTVWSVHQ